VPFVSRFVPFCPVLACLFTRLVEFRWNFLGGTIVFETPFGGFLRSFVIHIGGYYGQR
jgi:hypothetical protein